MSYYKRGVAIGADIPLSESDQEKSKHEGVIIAIVLGLFGLVFFTSPGAKHYYKHGRLPA